MFKDKKIEVISERFSEIEKRLFRIEEQLKPEPTFENGDIVKFLLIGNEFEGEIICNCYEDYFNKESQKWYVKYLDKNNVSQTVMVNEEDIWVESDDCIDYIQNQIEELSFRLKALENKKK